jgi:transcription antitermination factor NusG
LQHAFTPHEFFPNEERRRVVSPQTSPWYAVRVKSNRERVTAQALAGKGFSVCLPVYREPRRTARARSLELPLFPGYIFCRFDAGNRLPVLMAPGVVHIVSCGRTPVPVEEREMAGVLAVLESGLQVSPYPALPVGQRVQLRAGPLAGVEGVLLAHKNQQRFLVSVTLLRRSIAVEVNREWVRPAACSRSAA